MNIVGGASTPRWLKTPTMESSDADLLTWFNTHINHMSPRRRWRVQRAAENLWFYLGRQWIEARSSLAPGNGTYHFVEVFRQSEAAFPRPVTNLIAPAVDNEVSRLARKEYVPDTSAGKNEPEWMAASRLAKDILMYEIAKQVWDEKREHLIFNMVIDSITICRTWWDENDVETTLVAAPDAAHCPMCKSKFSSSRVPRSFATLGLPGSDGGEGPLPMRWSETAEEVALGGEMTEKQFEQTAQIKMRHCPFCEAQTELRPYEMSENEAMESDVFGRPMGLNVPRGEGLIDVISTHEFFPENGGLSLEPYQQKIFMQEKVRPLEWIALRFPEFRDKLSSEDASVLLRTNPLYSDPALSSWGHRVGLSMGDGLECYYNHARVKEVVVTPQPIVGLERGAHFIQVNDQVTRRELCLEVETEEGVKYVPRVKYHFARFKRVPGNFDGRTFVDDMKPLQRRLNEVDAQSIDLRERGKPVIWTPAGTEIYTRDDMAGSLNVVEYDAALTSWTPQGSIFPGVPLTGAVYAQERAQILSDMQKIGFPQDIEMGQSPGSVKTTSGLMLLSEEASQKRAPRERALINLYESSFEHLLQLNWALRKEDAEYEVAKEGGLFERKSFTGTDLLGNIRVKMNARAGYDQTLYNKEAAAEALQMGLYKLDSPAAVDRILDLMKLPKDVNENQTLQIERAEMAWSDFMREKAVPNIDVTLFDPTTWYSVLGKRWLGDEAYIKQKESGWTALIPRLVLWPMRMQEMEAQEAPLKPFYGRAPMEQWPQIYAQGQQLVQQAVATYQQAMASYQQTAAQAQSMGQMPPAPPPPPMMMEFPPPPTQPFLPDPLEEKIYTVWRRMLPELEAALQAASTAQELGDVVEAVPEADRLIELEAMMRMRAVIEAFRMMAQGGMPAAGAGPAPPPPPGAAPAGPPPGAPGPGGNAGPPPPGA